MAHLDKKYGEILDIKSEVEEYVKEQIYPIFERDIKNNENFNFRGKPIKYIDNAEWAEDTAFRHLLTIKFNAKRQRKIDIERCKRLHWLKYLLGENVPNLEVFSIKQGTIKTIIWDRKEHYVVILDFRETHYFLLSAHYLFGNYRGQMERNYQNRLPKVY